MWVWGKEGGGVHVSCCDGYWPKLCGGRVGGRGVGGVGGGVGVGMRGGNVAVRGELIAPIAMDQGLRFAVREGGKTVGSGVVTDIQASRKRQRREASCVMLEGMPTH